MRVIVCVCTFVCACKYVCMCMRLCFCVQLATWHRPAHEQTLVQKPETLHKPEIVTCSKDEHTLQNKHTVSELRAALRLNAGKRQPALESLKHVSNTSAHIRPFFVHLVNAHITDTVSGTCAARKSMPKNVNKLGDRACAFNTYRYAAQNNSCPNT